MTNLFNTPKRPKRPYSIQYLLWTVVRHGKEKVEEEEKCKTVTLNVQGDWCSCKNEG